MIFLSALTRRRGGSARGNSGKILVHIHYQRQQPHSNKNK